MGDANARKPDVIYVPPDASKATTDLSKPAADLRERDQARKGRFWKLLRYHYRASLKRPIKRLYRRYYAWRHRPPTPEETRRAQDKMRVAYALLDDYWDKSKYGDSSKYIEFKKQLVMLSQAARATKQARRLDPNASIIVTRDKTQLRYTSDSLTGEILYMEGVTHYYVAKNYHADADETQYQSIPDGVLEGGTRSYKYWASSRDSAAKRQKGYAKKPLQQAVSALEKAQIYAPYHTGILNLIAECYARLDWTKKRARAAVRKSLEIDPQNIDTLKLAQELRVR
jgi:hypothetical protein